MEPIGVGLSLIVYPVDWYIIDTLIDRILTQADVKNPARGHKVEQNTMLKEKSYNVLSIQRENGNGKKVLGKATPPKKKKRKRKIKSHEEFLFY